MANTDILQTLLHLHIATDTAAVCNLPSTLSALSSDVFEVSPHLVKWTNRVNALIHSREPGTRWVGITLALHSSQLSRNILISSAQGWVSTVLPILSRPESSAVWKASIRLLAFIFTSTTNLAEFQRHVVTPNVPKFSLALLALVGKQADEELRVLCLDVLAVVVPLYPTLHRQMASSLSSKSLNFLSGSPTFTPETIISSASRLHACIHTTGGKVGGAALWRKNVDETIIFCASAVTALRTTYATEDQVSPSFVDPLISVPLNLDRLRCGVDLLCHLLRAKVERPVSVPIQSLVNLCTETLKVTKKGDVRNDADPALRSMEAAAVPSILDMGCTLTSCLAECIQSRLAPHLTGILDFVAYHLEQPTTIKERLPLIKLLPSFLGSCLPPHEPLIFGRIIKAILPSIAGFISQGQTEQSTAPVDTGSKKGKKRARGYEGDEVFKVGRSTLCETAEEAELVLVALEALPCLLRVPNLPTYLQSLSSRLLLSLLIALPKLPPTSVALNPRTKGEILCRVKSICVEFASGSSTVLSNSLPLVIDALVDDELTCGNAVTESSSRNTLLLDLMIHPRLPPLLRSLPPLDAFALCLSEEGKEEREAREALESRGLSDGLVNDTSEPAALTHVDEQEFRVEPSNAPTHPGTDQPMPPIVLPAVPVRPAAPLVVQPIPTVAAVPSPASLPSTGHSATQSKTTIIDTDGPISTSTLETKDEPETPMKQPAEQVAIQNFYQTSGSVERTLMVVDDEDEDEDIEMPVLNLDSPSESEME